MELVKLPAAGTPFWDYSQQLEAEQVEQQSSFIPPALPLLLRLYRSWDWMLKHEFHSRPKVSA